MTPPQTRSCPYCGSHVGINLRRCPHCQSYLGMLGKISEWAVPLNALSLFIAILAITIPIFLKPFESHHAELQLKVLNGTENGILFAVANNGGKDATLISASVVSKFKYNSKPILSEVMLRDDFSSVVIKPNNVYTFSTVAMVNSGLPQQVAPEALAQDPRIARALQQCILKIVYTDYSSNDKIANVPYPCISPDITTK